MKAPDSSKARERRAIDLLFSFVVAHGRPLAGIPCFPQAFDALLLAWTCVAQPSRLRAMEALEAGALRLPGVVLRAHRFGGVEFVCGHGGRELGHLHGHGLLDVRMGRVQGRALVVAGRVRPHHVLPNSGWVSFPLEGFADVPFALELLRSRLSPGGSE